MNGWTTPPYADPQRDADILFPEKCDFDGAQTGVLLYFERVSI
jgi:hypothetical protein